MTAHHDSPTGQQFHARYKNRDGDWMWLSVHDSRDLAEASAQACRDAGREAKVFVRDVTPWREVDDAQD